MGAEQDGPGAALCPPGWHRPLGAEKRGPERDSQERDPDHGDPRRAAGDGCERLREVGPDRRGHGGAREEGACAAEQTLRKSRPQPCGNAPGRLA